MLTDPDELSFQREVRAFLQDRLPDTLRLAASRATSVFGDPAVSLPWQCILSGEDYWCQGFSEPGAGSDVASLQLRAARDGDDYILNGSKIWTTHAHFANRMFALVRTSSDGKPQAGISFLLLDMATPGITIEPIRTLAGDHELNQVFFDDVRVPQANRLGAENEGWSVAKQLLTFERGGRYAPPLLLRGKRQIERHPSSLVARNPPNRVHAVRAAKSFPKDCAAGRRRSRWISGIYNPRCVRARRR